MDMKAHTKYNIVEHIKLNDKEREIFHLFTDFVKEKDIKTTIRVAGGWVRDKCLGRENVDIDFALEGMTGEEFVKQAYDFLKEKTKVRGFGVTKFNPEKSKHLETAKIQIMDMWIDVVNLRGETYESHSRIPNHIQQTQGTPEDDALRRDLTINSLFYNLHTEQIEDFTGKGLEDLKQGIARTPLDPTQTFTDDPLRILRVFRFVARFDLDLDPGIIEALKKPGILEGLLKKVSKERIGIEMKQMLSHPAAFQSVSNLWTHNVLPYAIGIPEKCNDLYEKDELVNQCFKKGYLLAEQLHRLIQKNDHFMFTNTLLTGFKENPAAEARFYLYLACLMSPFTGYKVEIRAKPLKLENLVPILVKEEFKFTNTDSDVMNVNTLAQKDFRDLAADFMKGNDILIDAARIIKEYKKELGFTWEVGFILAFLNEVVEDPKNIEKIMEVYSKLYEYIYANHLARAFELKPLLDGTKVQETFGVKGQTIQTVKDNIFYWQIENPAKGVDDLLEYVKDNKEKFLIDRFATKK